MNPKPNDEHQQFLENTYDTLAELYDGWYPKQSTSPEPAATILSIASEIWGVPRAAVSSKRILDAACGTGNPYIAFKKAGCRVLGTDGSSAMLARARANCIAAEVSSDGIVDEPINWIDSEAYLRRFGRNAFDLIVLGSNSFCHLPPTPKMMGLALSNFRELLGDDGLLIIDTKKYVDDGSIDGVTCHKELRFDTDTQKWIERRFRPDGWRPVDGIGQVHFESYLHHDVEHAFDEYVARSLIVMTAHGPGLGHKVICVPYYPLPATKLAELMHRAEFSTSIREAPANGWHYDIVIGRKI